MNLSSTLWRLVIILLSFSIKFCPLLPAGCQIFNGLGSLTVHPARLFLIGSDLTVYCNTTKCHRGFKMSLELNGVTVNSWEKLNCNTMRFNLFNVRIPRSIVLCKLKNDQLSKIVGGLDLHGGLHPDKPENILCETSRSSDLMNCTWERGQKTHLLTTYNISVNRENGTQVLLAQIQDAEEITIPRSVIDENTTYQLIITAYNHFGASQSDPFILCVKDVVIPETPRITQIRFWNNSLTSVLQWKTSEFSQGLRPDVRLRTDNSSWEVEEGTELSKGLIQVDGLRPLTEYEFKMRICNPPSGLTHTNTLRSNSSKRSFCSKWSPSVRGRSPGKGPAQQLHVWRELGSLGTDWQRLVTVLWKPLSPEDYSGEVQKYKIFLGKDQKREVTCSAALSRCSVQVPAEVQALSVSAVTLYGTSPPADVPLRHSHTPSDFGPVLRELAPAANGSAVFISWSWPENRQWPTSGGEPLHYVLEWTGVPEAELQWQKVAKDQNSTFITGLTAGVRYNISLYAVTSRGVSAPSSGLVYSQEQKPESGPIMSVLVHEVRRIRIQWDEPPVDEQKGFITNYNVYLQTLDSSKTKLNETVSGSGPRQMWLNCPEGALALQMTASTSAGEGKRGNRIWSQPKGPLAVHCFAPVLVLSLYCLFSKLWVPTVIYFGPVIVSFFIVTVFIAVIANLMCWSCVRERIRQKCISWGPVWLDENLPKLGNSNAIKLLEHYGSEVSFSSTHSDPPLSPISFVSQEDRDDVYPNIHIETSQVVSGPTEATVEMTPLLTSDPEMMLVDSQLDVGYKPQLASLAPQGEEVKETEEEQRDIPSSGEEDRCMFGGLLGVFLSSVEVDFTDPSLGPTLSPVGGLLWPKTQETTNVMTGGLLLGRMETENDVEVDSPSLDLQQGEIMTSDTVDTCLSPHTVGTTFTGGYFPQTAAVSSTT